MSFFQNPFDEEFRGSLPFGDRQYSLTFAVPPNRNQNQAMIAWNFQPYDFSTYNNLTVNFAIDNNFKNYAAITIDVAGSTASATLASEVVTALNDNATFADRFIASIVESNGGIRVGIKAKVARTSIRCYVSNSSAERILKFNRYAGVAELPTYYVRHTIDNRFTYDDCTANLILLDTGDAVDQAIITDAGFDYNEPQADWQLLKGRVGLFNCQKLEVDGSDRITQIIEYPTGAIAGFLGRKTLYTYTSDNTKPDTIAEIPYTITDDDLFDPEA